MTRARARTKGSAPAGDPAAVPPKLSVIVPTLNEAAFLPGLLTALAGQTHPPDEVVVADAGSVDDTVAIARSHGARVVPGGPPGVARNAGAKATSGDLLLFLDADVLPGPDFIERALDEFTARGLDAATAAIVPLERDWDFRLVYLLVNVGLQAVAHVRTHAVGACILVRRALHEHLGGFDEALAMAEDHDYARRASEQGRFAVLRHVRIPTSMRRVLKLGRLPYARVTLASELRFLAGRPARELPPGYELGGSPEQRPQEPDLRLGHLERWCRVLAHPSTEVQGDAIAVAVVAGVAAAGVGGFTRARWTLAATAGFGAVAVAATALALRTVRQERSYGRFFSTTVATASADVEDSAGTILARTGVDQVCEFHAVHNLRAMGALRRHGLRGRLTVRLEIYEGIRALADAFDDPHYAAVTALVARGGIARSLLQVGFTEAPAPPLDLANRVEKWLLARRTGTAGSIPDCLLVMPRAVWEQPETRAAVDALLRRWHTDLEASGGPLD